MTRAVDDEVVSDDGVGVRYADPVPALRTAEDVVQADVGQVWSLTQFYSVDFSKSRIGVKKCVFNKRTIKVYVSCC